VSFIGPMVAADSGLCRRSAIPRRASWRPPAPRATGCIALVDLVLRLPHCGYAYLGRCLQPCQDSAATGRDRRDRAACGANPGCTMPPYRLCTREGGADNWWVLGCPWRKFRNDPVRLRAACPERPAGRTWSLPVSWVLPQLPVKRKRKLDGHVLDRLQQHALASHRRGAASASRHRTISWQVFFEENSSFNGVAPTSHDDLLLARP